MFSLTIFLCLEVAHHFQAAPSVFFLFCSWPGRELGWHWSQGTGGFSNQFAIITTKPDFLFLAHIILYIDTHF